MTEDKELQEKLKNFLFARPPKDARPPSRFMKILFIVVLLFFIGIIIFAIMGALESRAKLDYAVEQAENCNCTFFYPPEKVWELSYNQTFKPIDANNFQEVKYDKEKGENFYPR